MDEASDGGANAASGEPSNDEGVNTPSSRGNVDSDDADDDANAKSHNFRKRRLSLPRHHIETNAASPPPHSTTVKATEDKANQGSSINDGDASAATSSETKDHRDDASSHKESWDSEAEEKAHTFRKRRLSITIKLKPEGEQQQQSLENSKKNANDGDASVEDQYDEEPERKRTRRDSAESGSYNLEDTTNPAPRTPIVRGTLKRTESRILHSGEMMSGQLAPPSPVHHPVLHNQNPLPPSQTSILDEHEHGLSDDGGDHNILQSHSMEVSPRRSTRKKRRQSWKMRHHHVDEEKLPFPKDIVGTYSCHGVEPIYDSDYEEQPQQEEEDQGDEEDDGGFWGDENEDAAAGGEVTTDQHDKTHPDATEQPETASAGNDDGDDGNDGSNENDDEQREAPPQQEESENADEDRAEESGTEKPAPTTAAISAKINQDRGGITFPYANNERTALFSVYDGHGQGGELVSQFALHEIQRRLEKHEDFHSDLEKAMRDTFLSVDEALKDEPIIEPYFAGTTACVALLQDKKITLANAGDSRAVMARKRPDGQWNGIDLTIDQNPDSPDEMDRILKRGGYVSPPPGPGLSARVWLDEEMTQIGLAMARSIGDHAVADVGVIADPVVSSYNIVPDDDFMILASDGVWEFIESEEAVQIVGDHLDELGATKACQALIEAAASKWHEEEGEYRDDITAIVVRVHHLWGDN